MMVENYLKSRDYQLTWASKNKGVALLSLYSQVSKRHAQPKVQATERSFTVFEDEEEGAYVWILQW